MKLAVFSFRGLISVLSFKNQVSFKEKMYLIRNREEVHGMALVLPTQQISLRSSRMLT